MTSAEQSTETYLVIGLHDSSGPSPEVVGTKAATLAYLASRGFRVPEGFVLTTAACDRIVATHDIPQEVWAEVLSRLEQLGDGPLAVRSSGLVEDQAGASYAGQYETVLGVEGPDAVAIAIGRCLASATSERVRAYRGSDASAPMAVLVQKMVPAEAAGVAFTANPISGDAEVLVSAVKGLGDRLVSGEATPDEWIVRGNDVSCIRSPEGALDRVRAGEIARLAKEVERLFGSPQDIEWALADGSPFVLQARPITALPIAPAFEVPSGGFWLKDTSHFPTPLTPFGASVYLPALSAALPPLAEELGLLFEGIEQRSLGGEVYLHVVPVGGKERPAPPPWAMWLAARLAPPLRRRARVAESAIASRLPERILDSWERERRATFSNEIGELRSIDLASLDDEALVAHLDRLKDLLDRGEGLHFRLHAPHSLALYELGVICQELFGWDVTQALHLLIGSSGASSEPGRELKALAERIAADSPALQAFTGPSEHRLSRLRQDAPWAADAFEDYLRRYGHRTTSYDPGDPTLFERAEVLVGLLADQVRDVAAASEVAGAAQDALARARAELAGRSDTDKARFERALAYAQRAYGQREDNTSMLDNQPCALLRYCAVEIGRRLEARRVLAHASDAVFLEERELRDALIGQQKADQRGLVAQRKAERAWVIAHPGPLSYGKDPGDPPDLSPLPPALRLVNAAFINQVQLLEAPPTPQPSGSELRGVPGSPGRSLGRVRVIRDQTEFDRLRPGEVLVAPTTSPPWSVLFLQAAAVVTDSGGVLSHTAVIAREYGIPAVLATGEATRRLSDGDQVTVDGTTGIVSMTPRSLGFVDLGPTPPQPTREGTMGETDVDGLEGLTPKQQRHFFRSRRMLRRFPHTPRLFGQAHRTVFSLTGGRLGGTLQGTPIGLLTTTGRHSGRTRTVPIGYTDDGSRFLVAASNFGLDAPPAWYLNLRTHPNAKFHTRAGIECVVARELTDLEREELWPSLLEHHPIWGICQSSTKRQIALVALERPQHRSPDLERSN
jgi:rifampicin phosphotransferase